jgi:small conductance mechanosensitive channel
MDNIMAFFETHHPLRHLATAILILVLGVRLARLISHWLDRTMTRAQIEPTVVRFVINITHIVLVAIVVMMALSRLGIQTTSLLAVLSAAGLAVGLALQGALSNLSAGLLLIIFRPFKAGDFIGAAGVQGTVQEVHILTTTLNTIDNLRLIVPNSQITNSIITNFLVNDTRRVDFTVGVSYEDDLQKVRQLLEALLAEHPLVLKEPAPFIGISELAESSVNTVIRVWVQRRDFQKVRFGLLEQIKLVFDEHGITIPYPQRTLHVHNGLGGQATALPQQTQPAPDRKPAPDVEGVE